MAVRRAAQNGCAQKRFRMWQLGLVHQRNGYFEGDLSARFHEMSYGKQNPTCGQIEGRCKLQEFFPRAFSTAYEERDRNEQSLPLTSFRDGTWTLHCTSPASAGPHEQPKSAHKKYI